MSREKLALVLLLDIERGKYEFIALRSISFVSIEFIFLYSGIEKQNSTSSMLLNGCLSSTL